VKRLANLTAEERQRLKREVGTHAAAYLDALEYEEASPNTLTAYEHVLSLFCVEHANLGLEDLEPPKGGQVVRAFLDRHWRHSAAATRRQRLAIVRSFLRWLVGEGLLRANPAQNIRGPREKRKEPQPLPHDDVERLIAAQPSLRDQVALMCLAWLGLRKSELGQLRIGDFNLAAATVTVHGKGGHVDTLPIGFKRLRGALELHLVERGGAAGEYLLHPGSARTRPMDRSTLHRWLKRCLERAGLPTSIQTRQLRNTAGQALYDERADLVLAQELYRHGDIRTTRGYIRSSQEQLRAAMAALEASWADK
jgi:site-specific recombinase XerC